MNWTPKDRTEQEQRLTRILSDLGLRSESQAKFGQYTVDVYIPEINVVVEADGFYGHLAKADEVRDDNLIKMGINEVWHTKETSDKGIKEFLMVKLRNHK